MFFTCTEVSFNNVCNTCHKSDVNISAIPCAEAKNPWYDYERVKAFLYSPLNSVDAYDDMLTK